MKTIFSILTITLLLVVNTTVFSHDEAPHKSKINHKYTSQVNWHSLKEGLRISKTLKKPLLVDFGVEEGCHRCKFMQKNVYGNDEILQKINSDFVPIFINLGKPLSSQEIALGDKYDYKKDCLLLFLNHKSEIVHGSDGDEMCLVGKIEPQVFIDDLDYIIQTYDHSITN